MDPHPSPLLLRSGKVKPLHLVQFHGVTVTETTDMEPGQDADGTYHVFNEWLDDFHLV